MKILDIIKNLGPAVATVLAPATGGMSLGVLAAVKAITGTDDQEVAEEILRKSPGKRAEFEFKLQELAIAEQGQALEFAQKERDSLLAGQQNARSMNIAMQTTKQAWVQPALALLAVVGFYAALYALFTGVEITGSLRDIIIFMLSALVVMHKDVYSFYFGSSQGSKDKDALRIK